MTTDQSYREKAWSTRRAARAHLLELRAARRARRGVVAHQRPDLPSDSDSQFVVDPGLLFAPEAAAGAEPEPAVESGIVEYDETDSAELQEQRVDDTEPPAQVEEASATSNEPPTLDAAENPSPPPDSSTCDLPPSELVSDLSSLPGAGEGMIWLFHQCGIRTLGDLAMADADDLSRQLGVVGHILDITPWIEFARGAPKQGRGALTEGMSSAQIE
ncbi:MAG: hypothetical protein AAFY80_08855 [Pseudomonadota bacterium]